jgi:hypothetical protein
VSFLVNKLNFIETPKGEEQGGAWQLKRKKKIIQQTKETTM